MFDKVVLGTVQFGLDYGISNPKGKVSMGEVQQILDFALSQQITTLDTAMAYGEAHNVLGSSEKSAQFKIVSKLRSVTDDQKNICEEAAMREMVERGLVELKVQKLEGLLLHHPRELNYKNGRRIANFLHGLKKDNIVQKIGISVYNHEEIEETLNYFTPDIVQLPFSIFNQSLLKSGKLQKLKDQGVEIHARSIFLQGLLFMRPETLHDFFGPVRPLLQNFHSVLKEKNISPLKAALDFAMNAPEIDKIVLGVTSETELKEIVSEIKKEGHGDIDFKQWALADEFNDPSIWPRLQRV